MPVNRNNNSPISTFILNTIDPVCHTGIDHTWNLLTIHPILIFISSTFQDIFQDWNCHFKEVFMNIVKENVNHSSAYWKPLKSEWLYSSTFDIFKRPFELTYTDNFFLEIYEDYLVLAGTELLVRFLTNDVDVCRDPTDWIQCLIFVQYWSSHLAMCYPDYLKSSSVTDP